MHVAASVGTCTMQLYRPISLGYLDLSFADGIVGACFQQAGANKQDKRQLKQAQIKSAMFVDKLMYALPCQDTTHQCTPTCYSATTSTSTNTLSTTALQGKQSTFKVPSLPTVQHSIPCCPFNANITYSSCQHHANPLAPTIPDSSSDDTPPPPQQHNPSSSTALARSHTKR